jgi:RNA polymerase sigma-32 factor
VGTATLHELAEEFGVSAERIRQIEAKALLKLRAELAAFV